MDENDSKINENEMDENEEKEYAPYEKEIENEVGDEDDFDDNDSHADQIYEKIFDEKGKKLNNGVINYVYEQGNKVIKIPMKKAYRTKESGSFRKKYEENLSSKPGYDDYDEFKNNKWRRKYITEANFVRHSKYGECYGVIEQKKLKADLRKFVSDELYKLDFEHLKQCIRSFCRQMLKQDAVLKNKGVTHNDIKPNNILIEETFKEGKTKYILKLDDPNDCAELRRIYDMTEIKEGLNYININTHNISIPNIFGQTKEKKATLYDYVSAKLSLFNRTRNCQPAKDIYDQYGELSIYKHSKDLRSGAWTRLEAKSFWHNFLSILDTYCLMGVAGWFLQNVDKYMIQVNRFSTGETNKLKELVEDQKKDLKENPFLRFENIEKHSRNIYTKLKSTKKSTKSLNTNKHKTEEELPLLSMKPHILPDNQCDTKFKLESEENKNSHHCCFFKIFSSCFGK